MTLEDLPIEIKEAITAEREKRHKGALCMMAPVYIDEEELRLLLEILFREGLIVGFFAGLIFTLILVGIIKWVKK